MSDKLALSKKILATHHDGITIFLVGLQLMRRGEFERAEVAFREAATTPSVVDVSKPTRFLAWRSGFQNLISGKYGQADRATVVSRMFDSLSLLLVENDGDPDKLYYYGQFAWQTGEAAMLIRIAETWRRLRPAEFGPEIYFAYYFLPKDCPLSATEHALRAWAKRSNGGDIFQSEGTDPAREVFRVLAKAAKTLARQIVLR